jgi:hypothetical protein
MPEIGNTISHYRIIEKLAKEGWVLSTRRTRPGWDDLSDLFCVSVRSNRKIVFLPGAGRRKNSGF